MSAARHRIVGMVAALGAAAAPVAQAAQAAQGAQAAQAAPSAAAPADEADVRALEADSWVAWQGHDGAFFERFLSDDHVEVHAYGLTGKAAVVAGVRSPACTVRTYALGPMALAPVAPDVLLVTYRAEQDTQCGGQPVPSPVWATSLYARREGRWVNVLYQHTPVAR